MKTDTHKTKVQFLLEHGDHARGVYAYFPEEKAYARETEPSGETKMCYAHIGQHSACSPEYASASRKATQKEYADLKTELQSIGYNLEVID